MTKRDTVTPATRNHLTSDEAAYEVATSYAAGEEISDRAALTVASWWQSPGTVGHVLASLASGRSVQVGALLDDIAATRREITGRSYSADHVALDMLATWAINHPSREVSS